MKLVDSNSRSDGGTLRTVYRKLFDQLVEVFKSGKNGEANGVVTLNLESFNQTLDRLSGPGLNDLYVELAIV